MQVDVVARIPKHARRTCSPRAHTGRRVDAPSWLVDRYPDQLIPVDAATDPVEAAITPVEAAITSDVVPKPAPQPIKPTRRRRSKKGQDDG